jgi:hypothetical protein
VRQKYFTGVMVLMIATIRDSAFLPSAVAGNHYYYAQSGLKKNVV